MWSSGESPVRRVRLLASPQTTGEPFCNIVVTLIPPGGMSEGHTHKECSEYILFDIGGLARLDGKEYPVREKGILHAPKGSLHECVNTSPDKDLTLICFFVPSFEPYGKYPELIEMTKRFLEAQEE